MSAQTRVFGDKTFNAIGYGGMGLSIAYGSVGTDEERLKVVTNPTFFTITAYFLTPVRAVGSGRRL